VSLDSLTNGRIRRTKHYTAATIDWLAIYDRSTGDCYCVAAAELGPGMSHMHLRLAEPGNDQQAGIRHARDYMSFPEQRHPRFRMEPAGFEPATSRMQTERSTN
jgi:PD-(D/E)XK endonuclease